MQAGFDKLPALAGNGSKLVQINSGGTAMVALALTVGALLFGGAAGVLGQDGANLFWDNTAKRLGIGNAAPTVALDVTGAGKFSTGLTVSAGGITATGNSTITGALGGVTTLTASTSVVTGRLVINSSADASDITPRITLYSDPSNWSYLSYGASTIVTFVVGKTGSNSTLRLGTTSANDGTGTFTTGGMQAAFIDSGSSASLFLKTGPGNTSFEIIQAGASAVNWWGASGQATGVTPFLGVRGETNVTGVLQGNRGTGTFRINDGTTNATQFEFLSAPAGTRWITSSASATNPTLGVTGGSLAITPAVVLGSSLNFSTAAAKIIPGATSISLRNNADSVDNLLISDAGVITTRATTLTLGASPTIAVVSGSLAITPSVVIAGASLQVGANPASTANSLAIPYGGIIASRNNANTQDLNLISSLAINGINDVISVGNGAQGVTINGRVQAGAPSASDITSGKFMVWRDTSGATTKLYYNNGGVLQSVALA